MGFLIGADQLFDRYNGSKKNQKIMKKNAALQLTKLLLMNEKKIKTEFESQFYGTEVEYHMLTKSKDGKSYQLFTDSRKLIAYANEHFSKEFLSQVEVASWLMEIVPANPFHNLLSIKEHLHHFRIMNKLLNDNPIAIVLSGPSCLPLVGAPNCISEETLQKKVVVPSFNDTSVAEKNPHPNILSLSQGLSDHALTPHSRYYSFAVNIRERRGSLPDVKIPVFKDSKTDLTTGYISPPALDHMGFGLCNSSLQATYSAKDIYTARFLYDQLHVLGPIIQSLSNTSFGFAGKLMDWDSRFEILSQALDDRKPGEKLNARRYDPITYFISNDKRMRHEYNDLKMHINKKFKKSLIQSLTQSNSLLAKDKRLMNHFAFLFVKEFLTIFPQMVKKDNIEASIDFEFIQSTHWNDVRFKPPSSFESDIGWRVEFRPLDSPVTCKEKTALILLVTLLVRIISDEKFGANFYIPNSKVLDNYTRSRCIDSHISQKFHFRSNLTDPKKAKIEELTVFEIINGKGEFGGLRALIKQWMEANKEKILEEQKREGEDIFLNVEKTLDFFSARAKGELVNSSKLFRDFVTSHKDYKKDSVISGEIMFDLINFIRKVQENDYHEKLLGKYLNF